MGLISKTGGFFAKIKGMVMASTATKIATAAVVVAVVGGGTAALAYTDVFTSAERAVEKAAQEMEEAALSSYEEIFGGKTLQAALDEQGSEFLLEFTVDEISGDALGFDGMTLPDFGIQLVSRTNPEEKTNLELGLKAAETTLLSATAYADKDALQVAVPKLFTPVLTINYGSENFQEEVLNSYLVGLLGLSKEELETSWNLILENYRTNSFAEEHEEKILELAGACKTLLDGTDYEKVGKQEIILMDEPVSCKVYTATMEEESLNETKDVVFPIVQDFYTELGEEDSELFGTYEEFETTYLDYYKEIKDICITTYVHNKRIAKQEVSFTVGEDYGELVFTYATEGNPYENMELSAVLPVPEQEPVSFACAIATEMTEDDFSVDWTVKVEEEEVTFSFDYERLGGEFVTVLQSEEQSIELTGAVGELEWGRKIGLELDKFLLREGESIEEQELNAKLYLKVLESEVQPLSGEQMNVFQMTESDVKSLTEEISGNLMGLLFSVMGLFQ